MSSQNSHWYFRIANGSDGRRYKSDFTTIKKVADFSYMKNVPRRAKHFGWHWLFKTFYMLFTGYFLSIYIWFTGFVLHLHVFYKYPLIDLRAIYIWEIYRIFFIIYMFHMKYLHVFFQDFSKQVNGFKVWKVLFQYSIFLTIYVLLTSCLHTM